MATRATSTKLTGPQRESVEAAAAAAGTTVSAVLREGGLRRARELLGEAVVVALELSPEEARRLRAAAAVEDAGVESWARRALARAAADALGGEAAAAVVREGFRFSEEASGGT